MQPVPSSVTKFRCCKISNEADPWRSMHSLPPSRKWAASSRSQHRRSTRCLRWYRNVAGRLASTATRLCVPILRTPPQDQINFDRDIQMHQIEHSLLLPPSVTYTCRVSYHSPMTASNSLEMSTFLESAPLLEPRLVNLELKNPGSGYSPEVAMPAVYLYCPGEPCRGL